MALAAASVDCAWAQSETSSFYQPALTDPKNAQRFGKPADSTARTAAPAVAIPPGAGETGFDTTGQIAKKRKAQRRPGSPFPAPRAAAPTDVSPSTGRTSAPQIALRGSYANIYKPADAPPRRPLPLNTDPYDPVGIRVGTFVLRPSIDVSRGLDTNPDRTPHGPKSQFTLVTPELLAKSEWSRHEMGATLRGSYIAYDDLSSSNRPTADTKVFGRFDATRDLRFEGEGRFLLGTDNPGSPNLQAGLAKLPVFTTFGATLGAAQRFNRLDLSLKGSIDRTTYEDSELVDGSIVSNQDRNYWQYRVQTRASYEVTPGFKPFVELDVDRRKHDEACVCDAVDRSSKAFTPKVGVAVEVGRHLIGEASVGYITRDYVSPELQTLRGWVVDSSLKWLATGLTTVTLTANSRAEETVLSGVSGALRRDYGVQVDHAFRRWLIGTVKAGYGTDDYVGGDRFDKRTSLAAILTYKFNRDFWLRGEVRQEWMRSNVSGADYDATIFLLGMRLQR